MPEPYEWEWLKQPPKPTTDMEEDPYQVKNLQRWIELSIQPPNADESQSSSAQETPRFSRWQRRQQLKRMQSEPSVETTPPQAPIPQPEPTAIRVHPGSPLQPQATPQQPVQKPLENGAKKPMAKKKDDYRDGLKQEFNTLFETLTLQPQQKHYLKSRWLDQVLWMEGRAGKARDMHYRLRLTTIVGGVIIPALVSLNFTLTDQTQYKQAIAASTFVISQAVAICAATEQFFNYGDRWRHYRRSVETMKTQGWQFFELTGPYENSETHEEAFRIFANQVEQILQHDVEVYSTQVAQPSKQNEKQDENQNAATPNLDLNGRGLDVAQTPVTRTPS